MYGVRKGPPLYFSTWIVSCPSTICLRDVEFFKHYLNTRSLSVPKCARAEARKPAGPPDMPVYPEEMSHTGGQSSCFVKCHQPQPDIALSNP